jgi:hypothetical protein
MAATTLATSPVYVVPHRPASLTFTLGESGANYARIWCTAAPIGSKLRKLLDESTQSRVRLFETDGVANPIEYKFEKGGAYTLVSQEYTRGASAYGGAYEHAAGSAPSETKVGTEHTVTLYVGQRMTSKIGSQKDTATLVIWVWNDTIRQTTLAAHGEATPAVISPSTPNATAASDSTALKTALTNLIGVAVATAIGTVATITSEMVTKINAHFAKVSGSPGTHAAADTDNPLTVDIGSASTPAELQTFVSKILIALRYHYLNDATLGGTNSGIDSAGYHVVSAAKKNDFLDAPLFRSVGSLDEAYRALADIWRSYEAHRASTVVHGTADSTNTLTTLPKLLLVHKEFFIVLASASPTTPPTQSSGAVVLMQQAGFLET